MSKSVKDILNKKAEENIVRSIVAKEMGERKMAHFLEVESCILETDVFCQEEDFDAIAELC